jgi:hypothetical protein
MTEPGRMMGKLRDSDGSGGLGRAPSCSESTQLGHGCRWKEVDCRTELKRQALDYPDVVNQAGTGVEVGCRPVAGAAGLAERGEGMDSGSETDVAVRTSWIF